MATDYPKIENLYARNEETHKLINGVFKRADFAQVDSWLVTEKVDGTNIRIMYDRDSGEVAVRGRTDNASLPKNFVEEAFPEGLDPEQFESALKAIDPMDKAGLMVVYGEGYGPGIQNGSGYATRKSFAAFDVTTYLTSMQDPEGFLYRVPPFSPLWRTWDDLETVCGIAGLVTVPVLGVGCKTSTAFFLASVVGIEAGSAIAQRNGVDAPYREAEGIVARTDPYLYDWRGERVLFKLKPKDLPAPADE